MNAEVDGRGDSGAGPLPSWKETLDAAVLLIEAFSAREEGVEIAQRLVRAALPNLGPNTRASAAGALASRRAS